MSLFQQPASASVYKSCIGAVVNCFFGANLAVVTADLHKRYPNSFIRVAGDLDAHGKGYEYARAGVAAAMPNSDMVLPIFSDERENGDFNDLHLFADLDEVLSQLEKCGPPGFDLSVLNNVGEAHPSPNMQKFTAPSLAVSDSRDGTTTTRPLSEFGNALRLLDLYGEKLRFIPEVKGWINWCDGAWHWDTSGSFVRTMAGSLCHKIYDEGSAFSLEQAQHFAKWARVSQNARTIDAEVSLLSDQVNLRLSLGTIDVNPMLIGFNHAHQVIDLRLGQTRPASPTDYITKSLAPITIGDSAKAIRWHAFLDQIFTGDKELIDWLHRWCGYLLTGETSEKIFLFFYGLGANGKSVFAELIRYVMGDYGRTVASETLTETKRQAGGASPDLAELIGCRLATSNETEDGSALAESLVKSLTGGDAIVARKLYCAPVQFKPAFKLLILGNHRPMIRGTDHGIWRRVRLVPFTRIFSEHEHDPQLIDKLKAEAPHILAWLVQGCMEWQRRGLAVVPSVVANQTADYRQEQDVIGQWLNECTKIDSASEVNSSELYISYQNWATESGLWPASKISLGRRLSERGFLARRSNSKSLWKGLTLIANNHSNYPYGK